MYVIAPYTHTYAMFLSSNAWHGAVQHVCACIYCALR